MASKRFARRAQFEKIDLELRTEIPHLELHAIRWWYATDYEVVRDAGGRDWITPAVDANIVEWEPWNEHYADRRTHSPEGLLDGLCALHDEIVAAGVDRSALAETSAFTREPVLRWCREHGLFGIPLTRIQSIALPATWTSVADSADSILAPCRMTISPAWPGWRVSTVVGIGRIPSPPPDAAIGAIVPEELLDDDWRPHLISYGAGRSLERASLEPLLFHLRGPRPSMPNSVPAPFEAAFRLAYCEPLADFVSTVLDIGGAIDALSASPQLSKGIIPARQEAALFLSDALVGVRGGIDVTEAGDVRTGLIYPSLLSMFARLIVDEAEAPGTVRRRCPQCGKRFRTPDLRKIFCSQRCNAKEQHRKFRGRKNAAGSP